MPFELCNVDLEIRSDSPLDAIGAYMSGFGNRVFQLYCGEVVEGNHLGAFEIQWDESDFPDDEDGNPTMPEKWGAIEMIDAFCDLIHGLQGPPLEQWRAATSRVFDIGYESNDHCPPLKCAIPLTTLKKITEVDAEIAFTVYPKSIQHKTPHPDQE